jgi:mannose-6-phosphate isomerase-like protein (cupin superfamily)
MAGRRVLGTLRPVNRTCSLRSVTASPDPHPRLVSVPFEVDRVRARLEADGGGYEIVHSSPGLEIGVYVLVAPEPDRQQPHEVDEVYFVLEGRGALEIEGETVELQHGQAVFVPAGADHRFTGYEQMSVLVTFAGSSGIG